MNNKIIQLESKKYELRLDNFEGPLDLLCYLIDKNKMSVDELKIKLNFVKDNLEEILLDMELKGYIRQVSGYIQKDPRGF